MSRYIDADVLVKDLQKRWNVNSDHDFADKEVWRALEEAPSIDIVRCGECKYASDNKVYGCMLNHFNDNDYDYHRMYADDFCSYGEREGE